MLINNGIVSSNDLKIIQSLIPVKHSKARPKYSMQAKYITVHNTGNAGATGKQNADYAVNQNEYKSWHFTVGNNEVYQHLPTTESGWHCGDGENGTGNRNSIGIEIAEVYGAERTAIKFITELIKLTGIPIENIVPHKHWSGKNCPRLILPYWNDFIEDIRKELGVEKMKVDYKVYSSRIHEQRSEPKYFSTEVVKESNRKIKLPYCVNGSFQWWKDVTKKDPYPTSILIKDGVILRNEANHLYEFNAPQSVIYVDKQGNPGMKRIKYATELDYKNIKCAVGGLGLVNDIDKNFAYSPVTEGFKQGYTLQGVLKNYSDVLRVSNKTVFGYNAKNNMFYILAVKSMSMTELLNLIKDNSTGEAYNLAVMGDGGGAVMMNTENATVVYGDGRYTYSVVGFGL